MPGQPWLGFGKHLVERRIDVTGVATLVHR